MEETFLLHTTRLLVEGGILVYIIPHSRVTERIARHLAGWYRDLRAFKLPEEEYDVFKQCIIFGARKTRYTTPANDGLERVLAWQDGKILSDPEEAGQQGLPTDLPGKAALTPIRTALPHLEESAIPYPIPTTPVRGKGGRAFRFQYRAFDDEVLVREGLDALARLEAGRGWRDILPVTAPPTLQPLMTPKRGHIASQLSGGLLGTNLVETEEGLLLLKGGQRKKTVLARVDTNQAEEAPNKEKMRRVELDEQFETILTTLDESGQLVTTTSPETIAALIEKHVEALATVVLTRNIPQYDMDPEPWEQRSLDHLSRDRRLPGRAETGLTSFQRHLAIAHGRNLLVTGANIIMAEMGAGKTTVGLASAEYIKTALQRRDARSRLPYPALVVGPGIVTGRENWPKEVAEVTPGAAALVVTIGVRPLARPKKIGHWLREDLGLPFEEAEFEGLSTGECLGRLFLLAKKVGRPVSKRAWVALEASLQRAEQRPPPRRKKATGVNLLDGRIGGFLWLGIRVPRDENHTRSLAGKHSLAEFVAAYRRGELPEKSFAILSYETAKLGPGRVPAMPTKKIRIPLVAGGEGSRSVFRLSEVCTCPGCGRPVSEAYDPETGQPALGQLITPKKAGNWVRMRRRFCQAPVTHWVWSEEAGAKAPATHDRNGKRFVCGTALFENSKLRRVAAAEYLRRKAKDLFGLLIVDEMHQAKAKGTGVAWALTALHSASRYTLGLTGTLFGGYSTSIFWLFYRLFPEVRAQFAFNDERRWAEKFGLLKTVFYIDGSARIPEDGAYTGSRFLETVREKPGIGSAIIGQALERATFSSLQDIGLPLPHYTEEIVRLLPSDEMTEVLPMVDGSQSDPPGGILAWALDRMEEDDGKGAISVWLNAALSWPNAAFRDRTVTFTTSRQDPDTLAKVRRTETVREFAALTGPLPKETWLVETCLQERRLGRKTLVYLRQTGEHDIQPRLAGRLEEAGLRVGILKPSVQPRRRATWIKRHAHRFDVLLTNPRLVQVGLNLTSFSTGIYYELDLSLYVLWQSMRRLWRPGQLQPVKMLFPVYENTMEARMLDLMGSKMLAAQVFYGDSVGGALVEEGADSDLLSELVRAALGEVEIGRSEGLFRLDGSLLTTPIPESHKNGHSSSSAPPPLVGPSFLVTDPNVRRALTGSQRRSKNSSRKNGQLSLFD